METVLEKKPGTRTSEFLNLKGIEYFLFEEDFMENNIRCIPMIIRFKMDRAGIKLKLSEWSRFNTEERILLAKMKCESDEEVLTYRCYLRSLIRTYTGREGTQLEIEHSPLWRNTGSLPGMLDHKLAELGWGVSVAQWKSLTDLQRYALLKLCRPGHENKNFPKAMREFRLVN